MIELVQSISILEWVGYLASVIIAISMAFSSIVKFRVTNLIGAALFSIYGFIIGALPVGIMNGFIVVVDIYYLIRIFWEREMFELLQVESTSRYLLRFLEFNRDDIRKFFPDYHFTPEKDDIHFLVLRNMAVAGIFTAKIHTGRLQITLDYVTSPYRDFKSGEFLFSHLNDFFRQHQIHSLESITTIKKHAAYLRRIGFKQTDNDLFVKELTTK
ncbi:MAG: hypothetical protein WCR58_01780 [Bacteroidales bacterium]|jgi:hypothetical protein|nr:hypothetical protein [Bacteroidales bacterium]MDD3700850.1 hypothetical protein [Bacteroidales bacterium]MDY0369435.1 hypothetical protein [Bacteroidales bacterium]